MQTKVDDAFDSWKSLYSDDIQRIWKTERLELRRAAMVFHVLKQEFARIELNLSREMDNFKHEVELINVQKKSELSPTHELIEVEQPPQLQRTNSEESNKSPKLNKHRKTLHSKRPLNSPSLLDAQKEKKNNLDLPKLHLVTTGQDMHNERDITYKDSECTRSFVFKTPQYDKRCENLDVVESSFIMQDTPSKSIAKKVKRNKKTSKGMLSKRGGSKGKQEYSLTQMFDNLSNQRINITNSDKSGNTKQVSATRNNLQQSVSDDETFFTLADEDQMETNEMEIKEQKENVPISKAFLENYHKFPEVKSKSPQHAHKTEAVRRKADRMKLPGWSCIDCEQYYKGLNLSPEELRKKMNACSKHRNKFPLLDQTFQGYWDVAMPVTQQSP